MRDYVALEADKTLILDRHFTEGRMLGGAQQRVEFVGVHYMAANGSLEGCVATWRTRQASAHYCVESDGTDGQAAWDRDTAWALEDFAANTRSINVEHANLADGTITEACLDSGAHLVAAVCRAYGLGRAAWLVNVFPHRHFMATLCPGEIYGSQRDACIRRAQYRYDVMEDAVEEDESETTPPAALRGYTDLDADAWYIRAVERAVRQGWMGGYGDGRFGPDDACTRAQAVCCIANAARVDLAGYLEPFADVEAQPWYLAAVAWVADGGVVDTAQERFRPDDTCTRAELAVMLYNWMRAPDAEVLDDYERAPAWAHGALDWAVGFGVMGAGGIRPLDPCTRAEATAMLSNLLG